MTWQQALSFCQLCTARSEGRVARSTADASRVPSKQVAPLLSSCTDRAPLLHPFLCPAAPHPLHTLNHTPTPLQVPEPLRAVSSAQEYMTRLPEFDRDMAAKLQEARDSGEVRVCA